MIKIIAGTFGWRKEKSITALTCADGAVDLKNPELEARLVKKGVAVYANAAPAPGGRQVAAPTKPATKKPAAKKPPAKKPAAKKPEPPPDNGDNEQPPNLGTAAPE
jgi:hypothetical protein